MWAKRRQSMDVTRRLSDARRAVSDLVILVVVAAVLIRILPIGQAVIGGGLAIKLLFLGRTALLLLLCTWMLRRQGRSWADLGLRRPLWRRLVFVTLIGFLLIMPILAVVKATLAHAGVGPANYAAFAPLRGNLAEYLFWLLPVTVGTAAFGEEMIFRGFILDAVARLVGNPGRWTTWIAIVGQSILFGLLHSYQGVGGIVTTAITGLTLGIVWWIAGRNLWAGIVIHALLDGTAMTAIFLGLIVA